MEMKEFLGPKWLMWRDLAETQEFFGEVKKAREGLKDDMADGAWVSSDAHQSMANVFKAQGFVEALGTVIFAVDNMKLAPETAEKE